VRMRQPSPAAAPPVLRHSFRSMGTDVSLAVPGGTQPSRFRSSSEAVESEFSEQDRRFSRFRSDSELCRVNERAGRRVRVSHEFASLLRLALAAARETGGLFDPTVLPALLAAGYDRDFEQVTVDRRVPARPAGPAGTWRFVALEGTRLRMPPGTGLDFGGIAKGWTVDRAMRSVADLPWASVNAGGDLRVAGQPPEGELRVAVEDPRSPGNEIARLLLAGGALATSSVTRRAWGPGRHHLIDPRTQLPAHTGVVQATVWAPTCAEAEIRSKWALMAGPEVLDLVPALLVMEDGQLLRSIAADESVEVGA